MNLPKKSELDRLRAKVIQAKYVRPRTSLSTPVGIYMALDTAESLLQIADEIIASRSRQVAMIRAAEARERVQNAQLGGLTRAANAEARAGG
jgi:hypothetical protein